MIPTSSTPVQLLGYRRSYRRSYSPRSNRRSYSPQSNWYGFSRSSPKCNMNYQYQQGSTCKRRKTWCGYNKWLKTNRYKNTDNQCKPYTTKCNGAKWLDNSTKSSQSDATCRSYTKSCPDNGFLDNSTKTKTSDATCKRIFLEDLTCEWKERGKIKMKCSHRVFGACGYAYHKKKGTCNEFASANYTNHYGKQQKSGDNSSIPIIILKHAFGGFDMSNKSDAFNVRRDGKELYRWKSRMNKDCLGDAKPLTENSREWNFYNSCGYQTCVKNKIVETLNQCKQTSMCTLPNGSVTEKKYLQKALGHQEKETKRACKRR